MVSQVALSDAAVAQPDTRLVCNRLLASLPVNKTVPAESENVTARAAVALELMLLFPAQTFCPHTVFLLIPAGPPAAPVVAPLAVLQVAVITMDDPFVLHKLMLPTDVPSYQLLVAAPGIVAGRVAVTV